MSQYLALHTCDGHEVYKMLACYVVFPKSYTIPLTQTPNDLPKMYLGFFCCIWLLKSVICVLIIS